MTLGGLAIAIGGLVDDAVVDVENILRRIKEDRAKDPSQRLSLLALVAKASMEVRSAILYATVIIVLVFLPLFALPGLEGKLFVPLGIAFIISMGRPASTAAGWLVARWGSARAALGGGLR